MDIKSLMKPDKSKISIKLDVKLDVNKLKTYFNQNTFYGITFVGVGILAILYLFVFVKYSDKTDVINSSNQTLKAQVNQLQEYSDNMAFYQSQINDMKTEISDILEEYPAGAKEEDVIMLAVNMQNDNKIGYSAINMDDPEEIYSISYDEVQQASIEGLESNLIFAGKHATYVVTTTYSDLKSIISKIYDSDNRIGINEIVLAKNEDDGTLSGNIDLYFYSAVGTGKEYVTPDIAQYISGTDDIFNSSNTKASSQQSDKADEETEGELNEEGQ